MTEAARLYLLTPPLDDAAVFAGDLAAALDAAPAACVRLRMAVDGEDALRRCADQLRGVCHDRDVALVLTDHYRLVRPLGLDGVHLADSRLSVREARKELGGDAVIGAFGGSSRHLAMTLAEAGADYVALGPVAQTSLGAGEFADSELFRWWSEMIETPSVAEGGVTPETIELLASTADFFACGAAVWRHPDGPAAGARGLAALLA